MPFLRTAGTCRHGERAGNGPTITIRGSRERAADEHDRVCPGAQLIHHSTLLGRVICCVTCGRKVCG